MGDMCSGEADPVARAREMAGLLLETDRQIDSVLGNAPRVNAGALRPWIEGVLLGKIEEVTPENLSFEPQEPPFPVWRVVLVVGCILVVVIFALLVWLLVKFIRNRRSGGRSGR